MGNEQSSFTANPEDIDVKPEQIHKILLSLFSKLTNTKNSFDDRKNVINKLYQKYKSFINPLFPHVYQFTKTPFEYEFFIFVGTIGSFAIDMVAYYDLFDWIVLNDRTNFRSYQTSGSSKLQHCVSKRKTAFTSEDKAQLDSKKREVDTIISTMYNDDYTTDVIDDKTRSQRKIPTRQVPTRQVPTKEKQSSRNDTRSLQSEQTRPSCEIVIPRENEKVDCEFLMDLDFSNWEMSKTRGYKIFIDGEERGSFNNVDPISMNFHGCNKGTHVIEIQLVDSGKVVSVFKRHVLLKADCTHTVTTTETETGTGTSPDSSDSDSGSDAMSDSTFSTSITSTENSTAATTTTTSSDDESDSYEFPPSRTQQNSKSQQNTRTLPQSSKSQQNTRTLPQSSKSQQSSKSLPQSSKSQQSSKSLPQKSPKEKSIADLIIQDDTGSNESDSYSSSCLVDPYDSTDDEDIRKILNQTSSKSSNGLSYTTGTNSSSSDSDSSTVTTTDTGEFNFQVSPKAQDKAKKEKVQNPKILIKYVRNSLPTDTRTKKK